MTGAAPQRRSIHEKLAERNREPHPLVDVDIGFDIADASTSTFRVGETGELVADTAGTIAGGMHALQPLGELSTVIGKSYHLLALPEDRSGDEVEALAISVWNEAGWINPGVLHLSEGVTLEGPWTVTAESRSDLGLADTIESVWLLRCQAVRGAAPTEEVQARDDLARAFPAGMPVGVELVSLNVLRRIARRLGGQVRIAGTGYVLSQDPESAINLNVYTSTPLPPTELHHVLTELFGQIKQVSSVEQEDADPPSPHAMLVELAGGSQVLVGMRPAEQIPRALRWEQWIRPRAYQYQVTWANAFQQTLPNGQLTRVGRRQRVEAAEAIGRAAAEIAKHTRNVAIIDEDDFLVSVEELEQEFEEQAT